MTGPSKPPIAAGTRFGRQVVIRQAGHDKYRNRTYLVRCDCGNERAVVGFSLIRGNATSCGCAKREAVARLNRRHGLSASREHKAWAEMKRRCYAPKTDRYPQYGGRGIRVCARWLGSFENFYADMGPKPTPRHSLDRIDVEGNYEPTNCRWATRTEQARNTTRNRLITHNGVRKTLVEWAECAGMSSDLLRNRIDRYGWNIARALSSPRRAL